MDLGDDINPGDLIDVVASLKDLVNTLLPPTVLMLLARHSAVFAKPEEATAADEETSNLPEGEER